LVWLCCDWTMVYDIEGTVRWSQQDNIVRHWPISRRCFFLMRASDVVTCRPVQTSPKSYINGEQRALDHVLQLELSATSWHKLFIPTRYQIADCR
jgi:hypothetical protein